MSNYIKTSAVLLFVIGVVVVVALWKGMDSFTFAWILNFMLMMGVLYFTQTFKPPLQSGYYDSKKWEAEGKIYKWIGVNAFRKVLVWVGWEKLNKAANPVKKKLEALKHLEQNTRQSEFGHLIIFFIVLVLTIFVAFHYEFRHCLWLLGLNVVLNAYPIALQRYNRPRLRRLIDRTEGNTFVYSFK